MKRLKCRLCRFTCSSTVSYKSGWRYDGYRILLAHWIRCHRLEYREIQRALKEEFLAKLTGNLRQEVEFWGKEANKRQRKEFRAGYRSGLP